MSILHYKLLVQSQFLFGGVTEHIDMFIQLTISSETVLKNK